MENNESTNPLAVPGSVELIERINALFDARLFDPETERVRTFMGDGVYNVLGSIRDEIAEMVSENEDVVVASVICAHIMSGLELAGLLRFDVVDPSEFN